MIGLFERFARPLLRAMDPEDAHGLALRALKLAPLPKPVPDDARLRVRAFGLTFPNPVGLAAGFDKHAEVPDALLRCGFGAVEVGTVTPRPQTGNPRPRLFRLNADHAVINRFGFNSQGETAVLARLAARAHVSLRAGDTPVLVKIAPDLTLNELDDIVAVTRRRMVDGMIVSNTTVKRPATLRDAKLALEAGGLSGQPLFTLATRMLAETFVRVEGQFPLIGVGGIDSGATALAKVRAGANIVQIYSALVFRGLSLIGEIKQELLRALDRGEARTLAELVGVDVADITAQPWPE